MPSDASLSRFGVFPDIIPRWYAPMLNQPTSSPMMTRMFGFFAGVCAIAASPPKANGRASAVARRSFLNMTLPHKLLDMYPLTCKPYGKNRSDARQLGVQMKCKADQRHKLAIGCSEPTGTQIFRSFSSEISNVSP